MKVEVPLTPRAADFDAAYFDTIYRNYRRQNPPRKMHFYRDLIAHYGGRTGSILDVGCAFGMFLRSLPAEWKRHGIDISEYAIGKASAGDPSIAFAPAILETNPFAGPFDVVTSFDVIEHIPDRDAALDHLYALVKPGGLLVFVVPVYDGPLGPVVHLLDRDPTHVHKRSRADWLRWVARRFQVEEWQGPFRFLFPGGFYLHWPSRWFRGIAPAIAVVARKPR